MKRTFTKEELNHCRDAKVPDLIGPGCKLLLVDVIPGLWRAGRRRNLELETFRVRSTDGEASVPAGSAIQRRLRRAASRAASSSPKGFKSALGGDPELALCGLRVELPDRYFQVDHCTPYEVAGDDGVDPTNLDPNDFMLLCGSCNRSKSWSCEACDNYTLDGDEGICATCYWATPDDYQHIALAQQRRVVLVYEENEIEGYNRALERARAEGADLSSFLKKSGNACQSK